MCNKTWLMFIVLEMNKITILKLGKVLVCSEDCKRTFFFTSGTYLHKIRGYNKSVNSTSELKLQFLIHLYIFYVY